MLFLVVDQRHHVFVRDAALVALVRRFNTLVMHVKVLAQELAIVHELAALLAVEVRMVLDHVVDQQSAAGELHVALAAGIPDREPPALHRVVCDQAPPEVLATSVTSASVSRAWLLLHLDPRVTIPHGIVNHEWHLAEQRRQRNIELALQFHWQFQLLVLVYINVLRRQP